MQNHSPDDACTSAQILQLRGDDARTFASGQLASRIDQLDNEHWQWTAWLDATGKVRFLGMLWPDGNTVRIVLRGGSADSMRQAMAPYVLRSKVRIEAGNGAQLQAGTALPHGRLERDGDDVVFGLGRYSLILTSRTEVASASDWLEGERLAISSGHPWLPDSALDALLPPALSLHRLGAVALGKGCYPGQEMVNRLHHRGGHKFSLAHVRTEQSWQAGQVVRNNGQHIGTVLQLADVDALIVIRDDALDNLEKTACVEKFSA